ncbi:MAG: GTPase Era [Defluviitaleaceae bacterium]|nr:GTPase Era [Defluviitaleaceae bacterium]
MKSGFVSIIGRPNVGKSTLINALLGEKITITSAKPQTTRNTINCILNTTAAQIVLIDTPGIVPHPNSKLGKFMERATATAYDGMDIIVMVVTPDKTIGKGDKAIIETLKGTAFLVINKIDTIQKADLLAVIDIYSKEYNFAEIIPISALNGELNNLTETIESYLQPGPMYFPDDIATDQPERQIAAEFLREKLLHHLQQEIPHGIAVEILQMKARKTKSMTGMVDIEAVIYCERDSHKKIIIGKNGEMLKKIATQARQDIERLLGSKIFLQTQVKVKKDWRNNDIVLKNLGYKVG